MTALQASRYAQAPVCCHNGASVEPWEEVAIVSMSRFDEAAWESAGSGTYLSLGDLASAAKGKPNEPIVVETVIADEGHPLDVLVTAGVRRVDRRTVGLMRDRDGDFIVLAEPTGYDGVYHLVGSVPSSDRRWQSVAHRISTSAPRLTPCFLNHDDFAALGTALSEFGSVEVRAMSARHRWHGKSINITWQRLADQLRPDHNAAIQEAEDQQASVRSLRLNIDEVLDVHLRRMSGATFYKGDFDVFSSMILPRLATAAAARQNLMKNRARKINAPVPIPIEIRLPIDVFKGAEETGHILDELAQHSNLTQAVLHRNPYLHVTVTDHRDGSNFDVLVTEPNAIEIRPGFRASTGALTGLAQHLCERFAADDIRERAVNEPVSIYDLING